MTRRLISSGSPYEAEIGYSRAVVDGEWIFVSGTTGFDYATMSIPDGAAAQAEQCFRNIEKALAQADASLADVVRVHYIVPTRADFEFYAIQCGNLGIHFLRLFFDEPAAMEWLGAARSRNSGEANK